MKIIKYYINETSIASVDNGNSNGIEINTGNEIFEGDNDVIYVDRNFNVINMTEVLSVVDACFDDIRSSYPLVYNILMHKGVRVVDSPYFNTMATDGSEIVISPVFVQELLDKDPDGRLVEFVLLHEMFHILFDHCGNDDPKYSDHGKENAAQDYEINYNIENFLSEGPDDFPYEGCTNAAGGLYNRDYAGKSWEEIYDLLGDEYDSNKKIETSDEWKKGFVDGYNQIIGELIKQKKIELI